MGKELCKQQKMLQNDFAAYVLLVQPPKFVCVKCGRAAKKKKYLCNPQKM